MRYKAGLETRDRILESTRRLIAREGMDGTTIKAICDDAGVLPGSFYNLFDSKEQAILTVVREAIDAVDPDPNHKGPDTLSDLVEAYIRFIVEQSDLARVYIRLAVSGGANNTDIHGRALRHHEARVARFKTAVSNEHPSLSEEESERLAETLVTSLNGMSLHRVLDPAFDVARHARVLLANTLTRV
ncbi:MAG: TetR/AcrR family transcriptional regulator [Acidimicrobiia bacterium]|jgi:AcrR family transcriptional regulator